MTATTFNSNPILRPDEVYDLLVRPVQALSVALNPACATVVPINTKNLRAPIVTADPQAAWVAEAAEIPISDTAFTEVDTTPGKVAGLTLVTRELADDSSPAAAQVVGQGLARDIARQVDAAFLGNIASAAPAGLSSLPVTTGNVQVISTGATPANLDAFAGAIAQAAAVGARITSFILHPTDALAFAKIKSGTGFNTPLLQPDPTQPTRNVVFGVADAGLASGRPGGHLGPGSRPDPYRPPGGRHGGDRSLGVLHQRPGRHQGRHAGRVRLPAQRGRGEDQPLLTPWPGVKATGDRSHTGLHAGAMDGP